MIESTNNILPLIQKLLEVICKQHEAFKFQTSAFIDTVFETKANGPFFDAFKANMKKIYNLCFNISSLLEDSKNRLKNGSSLFQLCEKKKVKNLAQKQRKNSPDFAVKQAKAEFDRIPLASNPKFLEIFSPEIKNEEERQRYPIPDFFPMPHDSILKDTEPTFIEIKGEIFESFEDKMKEPEARVSQEPDLFALRENDSRKLFAEELEAPALNLFTAEKVEQSIYCENTFFKQNDCLGQNSQPISSDFNIFNESSNNFISEPIKEFNIRNLDLPDNNAVPSAMIYNDSLSDSSGQDGERLPIGRLPTAFERESRRIAKRQRGQYHICPMEIKQEAIRLSDLHGIKEAADILNIPEKNIKRWLKNGPERKKGAGRKTMDPLMEGRLLDWIAEEFAKKQAFPDSKEVKQMAKAFSSNNEFKASKGWCDKFMRRNSRVFEHLTQINGPKATENKISDENIFR